MKYKQLQNFAARYVRRIDMLVDWTDFFDEDRKFIFEIISFFITFNQAGNPVDYIVCICDSEGCRVWVDTLSDSLMFVSGSWKIRRGIDKKISENFKIVFGKIFEGVIEGWKQK